MIHINNGLPILNALAQGKLTLLKMSDDVETGKEHSLDNAEFDVYKDTNENGKLDDGEDNNIADQIITDKNGNATTKDLTIGKYLVKEKKAPVGYKLSTTVYPVEVKEDETTKVNDGKAIINEYIIEGQIQIEKEDKDTHKNLKGAEFKILDENNHVVDDLVTDKKGFVTSSKLTEGVYTIMESKAPEGYKLNPEDTTIEITKEDANKTIKVKVEDEKLEIPKEDEEVIIMPETSLE